MTNQEKIDFIFQKKKEIEIFFNKDSMIKGILFSIPMGILMLSIGLLLIFEHHFSQWVSLLSIGFVIDIIITVFYGLNEHRQKQNAIHVMFSEQKSFRFKPRFLFKKVSNQIEHINLCQILTQEVVFEMMKNLNNLQQISPKDPYYQHLIQEIQSQYQNKDFEAFLYTSKQILDYQHQSLNNEAHEKTNYQTQTEYYEKEFVIGENI